MSLYNDIILIANSQIGYTEGKNNDNKFGKWYGMNNQPWCMMFVQWLHSQNKTPMHYKSASCSAVANWYKENRPDLVIKNPKPGCIVIFDWGHTGIVVSDNKDSIITIEGNTSAGASGSQSNGDGVYKRTRNKQSGNIYIDAIKDYDIPIENTTPKEEDEEMTQQQFNEMFKVAMNEYRASLQDNDSSSYSEEGRKWAIDTGLIKGGTPLPDGSPNYMWQDFITREQMATLFYRYGKK